MDNIAGEIRHYSCYHNDDVSIQICTKKDYSYIPRTEHNWKFSVYRGAKEELLEDAPELLGKHHGLLDTDGWKRFQSLTKRAKKILRMVNQSKLRPYKTSKKYIYGFEIPLLGYEDVIRDSTSFMATASGRVQPSWRWINFTSMIPSMIKVSGQLLRRSSRRSKFILCMHASTGFYLVQFVGE
jgi:hypothetical protein